MWMRMVNIINFRAWIMGDYLNMQVLRIIILGLLWFSANLNTSTAMADVTYEEIEDLHAFCSNTLHSCSSYEKVGESLKNLNCHCMPFCSQLRTCCADSPYRHINPTGPTPSCGILYNYKTTIFLVDYCRTGFEAPFKAKCENEWNEIGDDLRLLIPVTSLFTNLTYKNYYCYRCHELHDEYNYWPFEMEVARQNIKTDNYDKIVPTYNSALKMWMAPLGENGSLIPVVWRYNITNTRISEFVHYCKPDVIRNCSKNWTDDAVRQKCNAYASIVPFRRNRSDEKSLVTYKNVHCALCNFQEIYEIQCYKYFQPSISVLVDMNKPRDEQFAVDENGENNQLHNRYYGVCQNSTV